MKPVTINARRIFPGDLALVIAATERLTGLPVEVLNDPRMPLGHLFPTGRKPPGSKLYRKSQRGRRVRGH